VAHEIRPDIGRLELAAGASADVPPASPVCFAWHCQFSLSCGYLLAICLSCAVQIVQHVQATSAGKQLIVGCFALSQAYQQGSFESCRGHSL
jgi:hypothetical protein